jgi:hypothetical protein
MTIVNKESDRNKDFSTEIEQHAATIGNLPNEQIKTCRICKVEGFPHEPIIIEKVPGRVLADGRNEIERYELKDYATELPHKHKYSRYYKGWDLEGFFK